MKARHRAWIAAAFAVPASGALWLFGTQELAIHADPVTAEQIASHSLATFGWNGTQLVAGTMTLD
ncbi:MAG TPA: hypothetical protein VGF97_11105 [Rhizomicrobium sp.]|jgi:hypothetical protein